MIEYDHKHSIMWYIFRVEGSVIPRALPWAVPNLLIAVGYHFLIHEGNYQLLSFDGINMVWAGYTSLLGFLMVFRSNQAYSRFWEGAKLIAQARAEWFNAVSSLFAFCSQEESCQKDVMEFQHLTVRLMSLMFCQALQQVCDFEDDELEILDVSCLDPESLRFLSGTTDRVEVVMQWVQRAIVNAGEHKLISAAPPILSRVYQELGRGMVNIAQIRKIKEVPFPFPYAQMISFMMLGHFLITPLIAGQNFDNPYVAGILCGLVTTVMWCLMFVAQEIDHPFGEDVNDLEVVEMQQIMNTSLLALLHPSAQQTPRMDESKITLASSNLIIVGTAAVAGARKGLLMEKRQMTSGINYFDRSNRVRFMRDVIDSITPEYRTLQCFTHHQDVKRSNSEKKGFACRLRGTFRGSNLELSSSRSNNRTASFNDQSETVPRALMNAVLNAPSGIAPARENGKRESRQSVGTRCEGSSPDSTDLPPESSGVSAVDTSAEDLSRTSRRVTVKAPSHRESPRNSCEDRSTSHRENAGKTFSLESRLQFPPERKSFCAPLESTKEALYVVEQGLAATPTEGALSVAEQGLAATSTEGALPVAEQGLAATSTEGAWSIDEQEMPAASMEGSWSVAEQELAATSTEGVLSVDEEELAATSTEGQLSVNAQGLLAATCKI